MQQPYRLRKTEPEGARSRTIKTDSSRKCAGFSGSFPRALCIPVLRLRACATECALPAHVLPFLSMHAVRQTLPSLEARA